MDEFLAVVKPQTVAAFMNSYVNNCRGRGMRSLVPASGVAIGRLDQVGVEVARRGFFAELNYQAQQAEKRRRQQAAAASRAQAAAQREAERAYRDAERAAAAAARASAAEQKEAQKFAQQMHVEARTSEAAARNAELTRLYGEIDGVLASTLGVDDYVDLESLQIKAVEHPPFDPGPLATPVPPVPALIYPPEPRYQEPSAPSGLSGAFGGKKRHEQAVAQARAALEVAHRAWYEHCTRLHADHVAESQRRQQAEQDRVRKLTAAEAAYQEGCRQREADAEQHNQKLSQFINNLAFDVESAIQDYVGVVLSNSVYPDAFPVSYEYKFDIGTRELTLRVTVPEPSSIPTVKEYRYVKARDEIVSTALPVKERKERYASAVWQVALRTLHEIFEADRAGRIHSIALTVGTSHLAPATGRPENVPLAILAADRETFTTFDLANVVPQATLMHLGAALSKSPFDLAPADTSAGVRVRGR
jgi:restriction system protein